jgi:hypothetical protein
VAASNAPASIMLRVWIVFMVIGFLDGMVSWGAEEKHRPVSGCCCVYFAKLAIFLAASRSGCGAFLHGGCGAHSWHTAHGRECGRVCDLQKGAEAEAKGRAVVPWPGSARE